VKLGAVLFDFDGVIVDTEPIYDRLTRELLAELGVHPPARLFDRLRGLRAAEEWRLVAAELSLGESVAELECRAEERRRIALLTGPPPPEVPGARRLVEELTSGGIPVAVVSSSPTDRVRRMLERLGLDRSVTVVVGGDAVLRGKPDPDGYLAAAAELGVPPANCVVIEDSERGIDAGLSAGAVCVQVTSGAPHPGAALAIGDLTALSAGDLLELVTCRK
jgi:HAD superfamily hydrolase (TIGR01509 family)